MDINPTTLVILSFILGNIVLILTPLYYLDGDNKRMLKKTLRVMFVLALNVVLISYVYLNRHSLAQTLGTLFN